MDMLNYLRVNDMLFYPKTIQNPIKSSIKTIKLPMWFFGFSMEHIHIQWPGTGATGAAGSHSATLCPGARLSADGSTFPWPHGAFGRSWGFTLRFCCMWMLMSYGTCWKMLEHRQSISGIQKLDVVRGSTQCTSSFMGRNCEIAQDLDASKKNTPKQIAFKIQVLVNMLALRLILGILWIYIYMGCFRHRSIPVKSEAETIFCLAP